MAGESFYDILNIRKDASPDEIKKAYRDLAKQYHPDKNKAPEAAERIKSINRAHEVLSNPIEREKYDKARRNGYEYDSNDNNSSWSMPDMAGGDPKEWFYKVFEEFATGKHILSKYSKHDFKIFYIIMSLWDALLDESAKKLLFRIICAVILNHCQYCSSSKTYLWHVFVAEKSSLIPELPAAYH